MRRAIHRRASAARGSAIAGGSVHQTCADPRQPLPKHPDSTRVWTARRNPPRARRRLFVLRAALSIQTPRDTRNRERAVPLRSRLVLLLVLLAVPMLRLALVVFLLLLLGDVWGRWR